MVNQSKSYSAIDRSPKQIADHALHVTPQTVTAMLAWTSRGLMGSTTGVPPLRFVIKGIPRQPNDSHSDQLARSSCSRSMTAMPRAKVPT